MQVFNNIQAVLFDLDGTLRHSWPSSNQAFFVFARRLGAPISKEHLDTATRWAFSYWANSDELQHDLESHAGFNAQFWVHYTKKHLTTMGCPPQQAATLAPQIQRLMEEEYQPQDHIPPEVPQTLNALRQAGFTLGVVSNRSQSFEEYLEKVSLRAYVDFVLAAGEINVWKPDEKIFTAALEKAAARPDQAVYVGDNYHADIIGAQNAGLHPVLLDPLGIFPQAQCPVIHHLDELLPLLGM